MTIGDWRSVWDEKRQRYYYYNRSTRETQWSLPEVFKLTMSKDDAQPRDVDEIYDAGDEHREAPARTLIDLGSPIKPIWRAATDSKGRMYYYNRITRETTWTKPDETMLEAAIHTTPPPSSVGGNELMHWRKAYDQKSGKPYFYNVQTKVRQWTVPDGWVESDPTVKGAVGLTESLGPPSVSPSRKLLSSSIVDRATLSRERLEFPEVPTWKEAVDPKTGRTYWYNKMTRETQWNKPEELQFVDDDQALHEDAIPAQTKRTDHHERLANSHPFNAMSSSVSQTITMGNTRIPPRASSPEPRLRSASPMLTSPRAVGLNATLDSGTLALSDDSEADANGMQDDVMQPVYTIMSPDISRVTATPNGTPRTLAKQIGVSKTEMAPRHAPVEQKIPVKQFNTQPPPKLSSPRSTSPPPKQAEPRRPQSLPAEAPLPLSETVSRPQTPRSIAVEETVRSVYSTALLSPASREVQLSGHLQKRSKEGLKGWLRRYFVTHRWLLMCYSKEPQLQPDVPPLAVIDLRCLSMLRVVEEIEERGRSVHGDGTTTYTGQPFYTIEFDGPDVGLYTLKAANAQEALRWYSGLLKILHKYGCSARPNSEL